MADTPDNILTENDDAAKALAILQHDEDAKEVFPLVKLVSKNRGLVTVLNRKFGLLRGRTLAEAVIERDFATIKSALLAWYVMKPE